MKSLRKIWVLSAAFLLPLSIGTGCKKEPSTLGAGALDHDDLLASGAVDTFTLRTFSDSTDSIVTDNQLFGLVGAYSDPKMGTMEASLYTQLAIGGAISIAQTDNVIIDSAVLALRYGGYYGKLNPQTFEVYRLDEALSLQDVYYRSSTKSYFADNLISNEPGAGTITPKPSDETELRLRLDTTFARSIVNDVQNYSSNFLNNTSFQQYFKGLHIKVSNPSPAYGTGGILYFRMQDPQTKMTIYYHLAGSPLPQKREFFSNAQCADFNHVDITNTPAVQSVIDNPQTNSMEQFYAQAFKTRAGVRFDGIKDLPKTAVIHQAILVLPVAHQEGTPYDPSANILRGYKDPATGKILTYIEGTRYDKVTSSYMVDLKKEVQNVVLGKTDNTVFYFYPQFMGGTAERIIFNGPNTTNKKKPRLIIKYTEY